MNKIYELEQDLLSCWHIITDLDLLMRECEKIEDAETADNISNIVLGIKYVYDMRFEKTWSRFEELIRSD